MTKKVSGLLCVLLAAGCSDAPRDNPLDPLAPGYTGSAPLAGVVVMKNTATPVPAARIEESAGGISVLSDSAGRFAFPGIPAGTRALVCTKDNLTPDTLAVTIVAGTTGSVTFIMNGAPVTTAKRIVTRKVDQYFPSPQYYVDVSAQVTDPNGVADLDSVWFAVSDLSFPMDYNPTSKLFEARVFKYDLPSNTIQWLVGKPLHIVSRDRSGAVNTSDAFQVTRVIEYGAAPLSPSPGNADTTSGWPALVWAPPSVTFAFTYTLTILRVDAGTETTVWELAGLASVYEEYDFPTDGSVPALSSGSYVWAVTVVDEFGNTGRSKETSFVVR